MRREASPSFMSIKWLNNICNHYSMAWLRSQGRLLPGARRGPHSPPGESRICAHLIPFSLATAPHLPYNRLGESRVRDRTPVVQGFSPQTAAFGTIMPRRGRHTNHVVARHDRPAPPHLSSLPVAKARPLSCLCVSGAHRPPARPYPRWPAALRCAPDQRPKARR